MTKVRQKILIALKIGRIKIKIDNSWGLPFSFFVYKLTYNHFGIDKYYQMLEILLFKISIIFCILEE